MPPAASFPPAAGFPNVLPVNLAAPTITPATATVGDTLTVHRGNWSGSGLSYAYQWKLDGVSIIGETGLTYLIVSGDASHTITVTETASNTYSSGVSATSTGVAVAAGFDPSQTPNTVFVYWNKSGNCYTDNPPTIVAIVGQAVATSKAQYGTSINATQDTALLRGLFQSGGIQFDALGTQRLGFADQVLTAWTAYVGGTVDAGSSNYPCLSNSSGSGALLGTNGGVTALYDDSFVGLTGVPVSGSALIRANVDSGGNASLISTGASETTSVGFGTFTFNAIAQALFGNNDSAANRYLFFWLIARSITLGSAEDLQIRAWITANPGLSL